MKRRTLSAILSAALLLSLCVLPAGAVEENYDTFDYRAYANVYPDLKAAYGYNAEKLYAHYVNIGEAEGRVGTFISGSNPKTNAPIYGLVPGTNQIQMGVDPNSYAVVPATLLDAKPPESVSQLDDWRLNQRTSVWWMSNAKLVAECQHTDEYMGDHWGGSLSTEAVEVWTKHILPEELEARTTAAHDVYDYEHGIKRSGLGEYEYKQSKASDAYKRALCSDTTILLHYYDYCRGKSTFSAPLADPGKPGRPRPKPWAASPMCRRPPTTQSPWSGRWRKALPAASPPRRLPRTKPAPGVR